MAKTKKTETQKRKVAKTKRPYGFVVFQVNERVLYMQSESRERIPAVVVGGPHLGDMGDIKEHYEYDIILSGDTHQRCVNEEDILKEPAPRFKRGDIVKLHNDTGNIKQNGIIVRVTPDRNIGYRCEVFWNSSSIVQSFNEDALEIDESEFEEL